MKTDVKTHILAHRPDGRIVLRVATVLVLLLLVLPSAFARDQNLFRDIEPILAGLSEITGWKVERRVPAEIITKDQLRTFVEKRIREEVKSEDIRIEELALKMFGLVPDDFDLKKTTVDLISEQAAAFYDPQKRKLSIIEAPVADYEKRAALVHELAHALADQHYHLQKYIKKGEANDDGATARQAVMEGQATWLMWAFMNREAGGGSTVAPVSLAAMDNLSEASSTQYPALESAPLYLRESLLFPYTKGLRFQDDVFRADGKRAFSEVFERAPTSTRQILHPREYLDGREYPVPAHPEIPDRKAYKKSADGMLGELDVQILLRQYGSDADARKISSNWRGGVYRLYEAKSDKHPLLAFATSWDSPGSARAFFEAYNGILKKKWKRYDETGRTDAGVEGQGDRGRFSLRLDGSTVISIEGLP